MALFGAVSGGAVDVGYDIIVPFGQSNASGCGGFPDGVFTLERFRQFQPQHQRVLQYGRGANWNHKIIVADNPLHHADGDVTGAAGGYTGGVTTENSNVGLSLGFPIPFAAEYVKTLPLNRSVLIVPCAKGATTIAQWAVNASPIGQRAGNTTWSGLNLFQDMVLRVNRAIAAGPNNRIVCALFSQGESDIIGGLGGGTWSPAMQAIIDAFRSSITGAGSVPILLAPLVTDYWGLSYSGGVASSVSPLQGNATNTASLQNAIDNIPTAKAFTGIIPQSMRADLTGNGAAWPNTSGQIHFSADAYALVGQRFHAYALPAARTNTLSATVPAAPTLTGNGTTGTGMTLSWSAVTGAVKYTVMYRVVGATDWSSTPAYLGNVLTTTISGLTASTNYEAYVVAVNSAGLASVPSNVVPQSTTLSAPATPTGLALSSVTASGFTASYGASTGATTYTINWRSPSGSGSYTAATPAAGLSQTLSGLTFSGGTSVGVTVTANNGAGSSSPSSEVTASLAAPATPTGLVLSNITATGFKADWSASSGAATYTLRWRTPSGSGTYTGSQSGIGTNTVTITGQTLSGTVGATIEAVNVFGTSAASSEATGSVSSGSGNFPAITGSPFKVQFNATNSTVTGSGGAITVTSVGGTETIASTSGVSVVANVFNGNRAAFRCAGSSNTACSGLRATSSAAWIDSIRNSNAGHTFSLVLQLRTGYASNVGEVPFDFEDSARTTNEYLLMFPTTPRHAFNIKKAGTSSYTGDIIGGASGIAEGTAPKNHGVIIRVNNGGSTLDIWVDGTQIASNTGITAPAATAWIDFALGQMVSATGSAAAYGCQYQDIAEFVAIAQPVAGTTTTGNIAAIIAYHTSEFGV